MRAVGDSLYIHAGPGSDRPCAVFVGGIHAVVDSADVLVYFAADLLEANASGTGLRYGEPGYALSAADLKSTIESLDVVILPCANPDSRSIARRLIPTGARTAPQTLGQGTVAAWTSIAIRCALGFPAPLRRWICGALATCHKILCGPSGRK